MAVEFNVRSADLPCAGRVALEVSTAALTFYVTAQPIYTTLANGSLSNPYAAITAAGIRSVISVRDPGEIIDQPNPYDLTEAGQLILSGASFTNAPLPHFIPQTPTPGAPQADLTQAQFNVQATNAAIAFGNWTRPTLVHCSTGDRASALFAIYLILTWGYSNSAALDFAVGKLVLQNVAFKSFVANYKKP